MKRLTMMVCAVLVLAFMATAKDFYVYPDVRDGLTGPQQMTNCLHKMDGMTVDTIHVMPGTYDFTDIVMGDGTQHLTRSDFPISEFKIVGETAGHWDDQIVFTASDGLKMMNFMHQGGWTGWQGAYPTIANITFLNCSAETAGSAISVAAWNKMTTKQKWPIITNCVFKSCRVTGANANGGALSGGVKAVDCKFVDCSAKGEGGAIYGGTACDSYFEGNSAVKGGAISFGTELLTPFPIVSESAFVGNSTTNGNGGAIYAPSAGCLVTNCSFVANAAVRESSASYPFGGAVAGLDGAMVTVMHCAFTNNVGGWNAGGVAYGVVSDSTFSENHSPAAGGALFKCTATHCSFSGDYSEIDYQKPGGAAECALTDCDVACSIIASSAMRCTFHDINATRDLAVFYNSNWVTNSLITRCGANLRGIIYSYNASDVASEFVNCTFADNTPDWYWGVFTTRPENKDNPPVVRAINCAFFGTVDSQGHKKDIWGRYMRNVYLDHCAYGVAAAPAEDFPNEWTNVDDTSFQCSDPKFAGNGDYQLTRKSPLCKKGALLGWTANDTDLAGSPRLRDGMIDIGCYECWLPIPGMMLLVR